MRTNALQRIKGVDPKLVPPPGSEPIGTHTDGRTIWRLRKYDPTASAKNKKVVTDDEGNELWVMDKRTGEKIKRRMRVVPVYREIEFILEPTPQGHVYINEHFRESEEQRANRAQREAIDEASEQFAERLVASGVTVDEFFERLGFKAKEARAEQAEEGEQGPPTPDLSDPDFTPWPLVMSSPGRWSLPPDGEETFQGKKVEAAEHIREMGYEPMDEGEFEEIMAEASF